MSWTEIDTTSEAEVYGFCVSLDLCHVSQTESISTLVNDAIDRKGGRLFKFESGSLKIYLVLKWNESLDSWNLLFLAMEGDPGELNPAVIVRDKIRSFLNAESKIRFYIQADHSYPEAFQAFIQWFADETNVPEFKAEESVFGSRLSMYAYEVAE